MPNGNGNAPKLCTEPILKSYREYEVNASSPKVLELYRGRTNKVGFEEVTRRRLDVSQIAVMGA
jgi:hypothetical protein